MTSHGERPRFVYYLLRSPAASARFSDGILVGGTRHQSQAYLQNVYVPLPPLHTQRKIAAILSAYDDLIENNNRRIKLLEEMAQRIYREWFVDFRYPGHEDVPLVDSELGPIPEGWRSSRWRSRRHAETRVERRRGQTYWDGDVLSSAARCARDGARASLTSKMPAALGSMDATATVIWSSLRQPAITAGATLCARSTCVAASMDSLFCAIATCDAPTCVLLLLHDQIGRRLEANRQCARAPRISRTTHAFRQVVCCHFRSRCHDVRRSCLSHSMRLSCELRPPTSDLRATRDLLLPRLISGEIDVTDLDIAMPEAAA